MTKIKYLKKEEALKAVTWSGDELYYCSPELKNNKEVLMAAIKENSWAFQYASNELKSNKEFIEPCGKPPRSRGGMDRTLRKTPSFTGGDG